MFDLEYALGRIESTIDRLILSTIPTTAQELS